MFFIGRLLRGASPRARLLILGVVLLLGFGLVAYGIVDHSVVLAIRGGVLSLLVLAGVGMRRFRSRTPGPL